MNSTTYGNRGALLASGHSMSTPFPRGLVILSGNSCPQLAEDVARRVGPELCRVKIFKGTDPGSETQVEIVDSVRGKDVFILQTGHGDSFSVNDYIMELLIMCYACKTSSARKVIGVIPYLPYSKQSKMIKRGCITTKLLASMLARAGMSHLLTMDLYSKEIQGFFDFPVDNLRGSPFIVQYIQENIADYRNAVIVARYPGVTRRANSFAERLRLGLAVIHGEPKDVDGNKDDGRNSPPPKEVEDCMPRTTSKTLLVQKEKPPLNVVGDVHGRIAIIIDDIIDEATRLIAAAKCLKEKGAYQVYAVATHGLFSEDACEQLEASPIHEVLVTNTVMHDSHEQRCSKIRTIDIGLMLAEAIRRTYHGESMSYLFRNVPFED